MKKIITLWALLCTVSFYAQHKVADKIKERISQGYTARYFSPLTATNTIQGSNIAKDATYAALNLAEVQNIASSKFDDIELSIPYTCCRRLSC
jgi:hypothetical protein